MQASRSSQGSAFDAFAFLCSLLYGIKSGALFIIVSLVPTHPSESTTISTHVGIRIGTACDYVASLSTRFALPLLHSIIQKTRSNAEMHTRYAPAPSGVPLLPHTRTHPGSHDDVRAPAQARTYVTPNHFPMCCTTKISFGPALASLAPGAAAMPTYLACVSFDCVGACDVGPPLVIRRTEPRDTPPTWNPNRLSTHLPRGRRR